MEIIKTLKSTYDGNVSIYSIYVNAKELARIKFALNTLRLTDPDYYKDEKRMIDAITASEQMITGSIII